MYPYVSLSSVEFSIVETPSHEYQLGRRLL
jgi:hypothetical protein